VFLFAQLKPLQFADGEILMHVFDVSYNNLSGRLPSFLDFTNVPEYAQRGIFIAVSLPTSGSMHTCFLKGFGEGKAL
jgi:hypothetical protein